jgi:hypothetical protein
MRKGDRSAKNAGFIGTAGGKLYNFVKRILQIGISANDSQKYYNFDTPSLKKKQLGFHLLVCRGVDASTIWQFREEKCTGWYEDCQSYDSEVFLGGWFYPTRVNKVGCSFIHQEAHVTTEGFIAKESAPCRLLSQVQIHRRMHRQNLVRQALAACRQQFDRLHLRE